MWSKDFLPNVRNAQILPRVIESAFFEEHTASSRLDLDKFTVRWSMSNEHELIFIVSCSFLIKGNKSKNLDFELRGILPPDCPKVVHETIR